MVVSQKRLLYRIRANLAPMNVQKGINAYLQPEIRFKLTGQVRALI